MDKLDLEALEVWKRKNAEERLKFVDQYAAWLRKMPNKEWSRQQKEFLD